MPPPEDPRGRRDPPEPNIFADAPAEDPAADAAAADALRRRLEAHRAAGRDDAAEAEPRPAAPEPPAARISASLPGFGATIGASGQDARQPLGKPGDDARQPLAGRSPDAPQLRAEPTADPLTAGFVTESAPAAPPAVAKAGPVPAPGGAAPPPPTVPRTPAAGPPADPPPDPARRYSAAQPTLFGMIGLGILVAGLFGWGLFANIAGAVIAVGKVVVETRQQVVQHPDGGVVGEIMVRDGDRVQAGDILLQLDATLLRSEETILDDQYWELKARRNRLEAEQFRAEEITFDPELIARAAENPRVNLQVEGQRILFDTRNRFEFEQIGQLRERQTQIERQIEGAEAQITALTRQLELIAQELVGQQRLFDQGLAQLNRVLSLQREEARLQGQIGELTATIAEAAGRRAEIEIQILQTSTQRQERAITEVRDIQFQENQVREQLVAVRERLDRLDIRAPIAGEVLGMTVFARRSVVRPADPILYIVPSETDVVVVAQIETTAVDQVFIGQEAALRFSAFSMRTTPDVYAQISRISADAIDDPQRGVSYYEVQFVISDEEMAKIEGLILVPGMPVEAYIKTEDRTPLNYLVKPLTDYFNRALRED